MVRFLCHDSDLFFTAIFKLFEKNMYVLEVFNPIDNLFTFINIFS